MKEEQKSAAETVVSKISDKADDLIVEAVVAMDTDNKRLHKRMVDHEETVEKSIKRHAEDLESKFEKSMADVVGAIDKLDNRVNVWQKTAPLAQSVQRVESTNVLREVIPDSIKALANRFEYQVVPNIPEKAERLKGVEVSMAAHAWFMRATQIQSRKHVADVPRLSAELEKISAALEEYHFGSAEIAKAVLKANPLQEDTTTEGGFLVPTIVGSEVLRLVLDSGKVFPICRQYPMSKLVEKVPDETTACSVGWIAEEGTLTGGEPVFGQKTLTAEKLAGRATLSIELFEDSNVAVLPYLLTIFSEAMGRELDTEIVMGDGSSPLITGIYNASGINAVTSATTAGRALTYALLVSTFTAAGEGSARDGGVWIVSPAGYAALLALVDSQGRPIVQMNVPSAPAGTILGKPIIETNALSGTSGLDVTGTATTILFGPPRVVLAGTRTGMRWDVTDQVNWTKYQMDCRLIGRFAGDVGVPAAWSYLGQVLKV